MDHERRIPPPVGRTRRVYHPSHVVLCARLALTREKETNRPTTQPASRDHMLDRQRITAITLAGGLVLAAAHAQAFDDSKYPDMKGQWLRVGNPNWAPPGAPRPPLTPEYQAVFD